MMKTGPIKERDFERCAEVREIWRAYRAAHPTAAARGRADSGGDTDSRKARRKRTPRPQPAPTAREP